MLRIFWNRDEGDDVATELRALLVLPPGGGVMLAAESRRAAHLVARGLLRSAAAANAS